MHTHTHAHTHTHIYTHRGFIQTYRKRRRWGRGEERELNTLSGSLVERATGLAPHRLICESLLLKQLCAFVHTLWRHRGSSAFTHLHINKPLETFIKCWQKRQYLQVELLRTWKCLARSTRGLANPQLHVGRDNVQLLQLPIALVMMESNTLLTLLALSTQAANLESGVN